MLKISNLTIFMFDAKNRNKKSRNISDFSCRTKVEFPSIFEIARRQFDSVFTLL